MSFFRHHKNGDSGSAAVELLILMPVFLLIIFAMLYAGQLSLFKLRTNFGGQYALDAADSQSEDPADRGEVSDQFYPSPVGRLTVTEDLADPPEMPEAGEIREMFDEMSEVIYATVATGRYVFSGGQLRFIVTTHQSQRLSSDGRYVAAYRLRENSVPELATQLAQGWAERSRVDLTYSYAPDYIRVGRWPLEAVDVSTTFQSAERTGAHRQVAVPPAGMNHGIDAVTSDNDMRDSGRLPDYPDFGGDRPFWEPN